MSKKTIESDFDNEHYQEYLLQKEKLKQKYDKDMFIGNGDTIRNVKATEKHNIDYRRYVSQLMDIICKPNSPYQKFVWETLPEYERLKRDYITHTKKTSIYKETL